MAVIRSGDAANPCRGDRYGRRRIFVIGVVIFAAAALLLIRRKPDKDNAAGLIQARRRTHFV
jgi:hypothetical protein